MWAAHKHGEQRRARLFSARRSRTRYLLTFPREAPITQSALKRGLQNGLPPSQFKPSTNNLFRVLRDPLCQPLPAQANSFQGRAFVIADATNASASFQFLRVVRENRLATIVGQAAGGNLQGINGDSYALLNLPNSRFEIVIPLYFQAPRTPQPDASVIPDHLIKPSVDDIAAGIDTELNYILKSREQVLPQYLCGAALR